MAEKNDNWDSYLPTEDNDAPPNRKGYIRADLALGNPDRYPQQAEVADWWTKLRGWLK